MRRNSFIISRAVYYASFLHAFVHASSPKTYVHLFEWSWPDIAKECREFLGPKGYAAVQISPAIEHVVLDRQWYERYQPVSYKLVSRSGNQSQFESMIRTCKEVGVKIYVDVVFNHMAAGCGIGYAGTTFCNRSYQIWDRENFHHELYTPRKNCIINWARWQNNKATGGDPPREIVWNCDLSGLPDLATEESHVQRRIAEHLRQVIDIGAQGLRIDAAKHMKPEHIQEIFKLVNATGWFPTDVALELYSTEAKPVKPSMYLGIGNIEYFDYSWMVSKSIAHAGHMHELKHISTMFTYPSDKVNVFLDNHDTQRNGGALLTYRNSTLYVMANVFMLAWPYGFPKVMSSFYIPDWREDGGNSGPPEVPVHHGSHLNCEDGKTWVCEHRIPAIANMVAWRMVAGQAPPSLWTTEEGGNHIAFARGQAFVAFNRDASKWVTKVQTGLPSGNYCDVSQDDNPHACPHVFVDTMGFAEIEVAGVGTTAFHIAAKAFGTTDNSGEWLDWHILPSSFLLLCLILFAVVGRSCIGHFCSGVGADNNLKTALLSVDSDSSCGDCRRQISSSSESA